MSHKLKNSFSIEIFDEIILKYKQSLMHKRCKQKRKGKLYLTILQTHENKCEHSLCRPVKFLRFLKKTRFPKIQDELRITQQFLPILTEEIDMEYLIKRFSDMQLTGRGKRRVGDEILLTLMPFAIMKKTFNAPDIWIVTHISCGPSGLLWMTDHEKITLLDTTTGSTLKTIEREKVPFGENMYRGIHSLTNKFELVFIDRGSNIRKISKDRETTTTFIDYSNNPVWKIQCLYSCPSSGDLLVGMLKDDDQIGRVERYNTSGQLKQTIPHDTSYNTLYMFPCYVTENKNGDVVVSDDQLCAVVVTSRVGVHRFSYTGPPPTGSGLWPRGICTDGLSHILVCDCKTKSIQMIDRDGQFMLFLLTSESPGITDQPESVSYDVDTHLLFVGSVQQTLSVYRYINKNCVLAGNSHYLTIYYINNHKY